MNTTNFDEDKFNMEVRKFLKKVGITSQREIEQAVRAGLESGNVSGSVRFKAQVTLEIADLGVTVKIDGDIALS